MCTPPAHSRCHRLIANVAERPAVGRQVDVVGDCPVAGTLVVGMIMQLCFVLLWMLKPAERKTTLDVTTKAKRERCRCPNASLWADRRLVDRLAGDDVNVVVVDDCKGTVMALLTAMTGLVM